MLANTPTPGNLTKFLLTTEIAFKTLLYSRKWIIYVFLTLFPVIFIVFSPNLQPSAREDYVGMFTSYQIGLLFTFGTLLLALPISSDEIQDNVIDLFISRPVDRWILFVARYIALVVMNIVVNVGIALFYYCFFNFLDMFAG